MYILFAWTDRCYVSSFSHTNYNVFAIRYRTSTILESCIMAQALLKCEIRRALKEAPTQTIIRLSASSARAYMYYIYTLHSDPGDIPFIFSPDKLFAERPYKTLRSITARISRPALIKSAACPRDLRRGWIEAREPARRREETGRTPITQSNTARLIRRKLRGCLPLSINFNSARGPPTEGAPPLATSVRLVLPWKEVRTSPFLPFSIRGKQPRKITINRRSANDPRMRSHFFQNIYKL